MKTRLLRSKIMLLALAALALCLVINEKLATAQQSNCGPIDSRGSVSDCGSFVDPNTGNQFNCNCTAGELCMGDPQLAFSAPPAATGECSEPNGAACGGSLQCDGFSSCLVNLPDPNGTCCTRTNIGPACQSCTSSGCTQLCGAQPDGCGGTWQCAACPALTVPTPQLVGSVFTFAVSTTKTNSEVTGTLTQNGATVGTTNYGKTDASGNFQWAPSPSIVAPLQNSNVGSWTLQVTVGGWQSNVAAFAVAEPAPAVPPWGAATLCGLLGFCGLASRRRMVRP